MRRYIHVHVGPCSPTKSKFACDMQEQANNFIELKLFIRLNILKYLNFNPEILHGSCFLTLQCYFLSREASERVIVVFGRFRSGFQTEYQNQFESPRLCSAVASTWRKVPHHVTNFGDRMQIVYLRRRKIILAYVRQK